MDLSYLLASPVIWAVGVVEYVLLSRGRSTCRLARTAALHAVAAVAAMMPMAVAGRTPAAAPLVFAAATAFIYQLTYPTLYFISNRRRTTAFSNSADAATGMCAFGLLSALLLMGRPFAWLAGPIELILMATVVVQCAYFAMYGCCMDAYGFRLMTQTNTNEVIEFIRYYPLWATLSVALALAAILCASVWINLPSAAILPVATKLEVAAAAAACVFVATWGGRHSAVARSGFVSLYISKLDNTHRLKNYAVHRAERKQGIDITPVGKSYDGPSTIILVIGESANRDYMSAFVPQLNRDTTPWLNAMHRDDARHWMLFPHAYSCGMHTFVALEQGLTEKNQFYDADFVTASSIVDIAHAAGRRVHWYSNQGHLGASLSQVSVIADESDEALWTVQKPGLPPYDMELLDYLDRVDPNTDNLVVLHLKGNHFSFENRYPAEAATWQADGSEDTRTTYMNSIRYVDDFLRRVWKTGRERLNLKAMVYCSDHAIIPEKHRAPTFTGFGDIRIPLAVWTSDDFIAAHPERHAALQSNISKYWTNDFLYDLMCGIMDVDSPRFNPSNSLAHASYAYTREDLMVLGGSVSLTDDDEIPDTLR